jgi:DNA-directed RNA polymerase subunit delta
MEDNYETMSEVDIAYQILSRSGKDNPLYFKKWIREVIAKKNKVVQNEAAAISEIYTLINMDSRFQHVGDGKWGLTDWYPPTKKSSSKSTTKAKAAAQ